MKKIIALFIFTISVFGFAASSEDYTSISGDGGWCWFGDPRAVYSDGAVYTGWISSDGSVVAGKYNIDTGITETFNLHPMYQFDDHNNPSFLILEDGRIAAFYTKHGDGPMHMRITRRPGDISLWDIEQEITKFNSPLNRGITYPNPYRLSKEDGRVFMFWRGIDYEPTISYSDDIEDTSKWKEPVQLFKSRVEGGQQARPYTKIVSNGEDEIHFVFTDGHPRMWKTNSLYYMMYKKGAFYTIEGKKIGTLSDLPIEKSKATCVYQATEETGRGWDWDIALDNKDNPVIVYTRMPAEDDHRYHYVRWDGKEWIDNKLCDAGKWFPQTDEGKREGEPHYSPGINLDHNNPNIAYLSKPVDGKLEIYRYETKDMGKTWKSTAITENSHYDNIRPFVVRDTPKDMPILLWEQFRWYKHYTKYSAAIKVDRLREERNISTDMPEPRTVKEYMARVADWQITNPSKHNTADWTYGAMLAGMTEWAQMADTDKYYDYLITVGEKNQWDMPSWVERSPHRKFHADDFAVFQMYLKLYEKYGKAEIFEKTKQRLDYVLENRSSVEIVPFSGKSQERWSWCDSLFMAPPVWAKFGKITGEQKYIDFLNEEWKFTTDNLFDSEENLYYRDSRYFTKREENGQKVFWSRGNGWVMGGLVRTMEYLGKDDPMNDYYSDLLLKMSSKIASIQQPDGLWHSSLLDPVTFSKPESSGSGFYIYALAWGVNHGYLDRDKYLPVVLKGWNSLCSNVHSDGMLGFTQPIGADPRNITEELTEVYGVGAFLLAGSEVYKLAVEPAFKGSLQVKVSNPADVAADKVVVEIATDQLKGINLDNAGVIEAQTFRNLQTQVTKDGLFLFEATVGPKSSATYYVVEGQKINLPNRTTYCRFVPERLDDFAWENNRIAFRTYGPALEVEGVNAGIDCWFKQVDYPVIDNWYYNAMSKGRTYHKNYGEGYDPYHVGPTAGNGGLAIWKDGRRDFSSVYDSWKVIENGPIRSVFELTYDKSWKKTGHNLKEIKRFSIDLDSWFTKVECLFDGKDAQGLEFAIGVTTHNGKADAKIGEESVVCHELIDGTYLGTAAILESPKSNKTMEIKSKQADQSHAFIIVDSPNNVVSYYAGFGWENQGVVDAAQWEQIVADMCKRVRNPIYSEIVK